MYGSIEAGGTKIICAVSDNKLNIIDSLNIATKDPNYNMEQMINFFDKYKEDLKAIGIGSFGPVDIDPKSDSYGHILNTPKKEWENFDLVSPIKKELDVEVYLTTDVNASAYGELKIGAGRGKNSLAYYTFGTGVGGGIIQNENFIGGVSHLELGHMIVKKHKDDDYKGYCYAHGDCLEGLACGPSISDRFKKNGQEIDEDDSFWDIEAYYIAQCVYNTVLSYYPEIIVLGGGVIQKKGLLDKVKKHFKDLMNNYIDIGDIDEYIVKPQRDGESATIGCLILAQEHYRKKIG